MGEIIQFDFNKDKKTSDEENKINKDDILFKKFVHFVISDKHKKFKNLEIKQMSYDEDRKLVSEYTNEQLVNWIVDSNESDWITKPSFYRAVYDEIKSRLPERYNK